MNCVYKGFWSKNYNFRFHPKTELDVQTMTKRYHKVPYCDVFQFCAYIHTFNDPSGLKLTTNVPLLMASVSRLATVFRSGSGLGCRTSPIGGGLSSNVNVTMMSLLSA